MPPAPCADPQPALILRLRGPTAETKKEPEEKEWPELDAQKSSKKVSAETARKNWKSARTASTLKEHHLDMKTFYEHHLEFRAGTRKAKCKFSERPKYDIQVKKPNDLGLDWVYSVPCGQKEKEDGPVPVLDLLESP